MASEGDDRLPRASTCFNHLFLPAYSSAAVLAERLQQRLAESAQRQEMGGQPAVLLVPPALRPTLARFVRAGVPQMHVIAWNEIPDSRRVRLVSTVAK